MTMQWGDRIIRLDDEPALRQYRQHLLDELRVYEAAVEHFFNASEHTVANSSARDDVDQPGERAARRAAGTINHINVLVQRLEQVNAAIDAFSTTLDDSCEPEDSD